VLGRAEQEGTAGLRPVDLCRSLLVRPPSITGLSDRLRRLGYVAISSSSTDGRGKEIRLTLLGRKLVERIWKGHSAQIAAMMSGLDEESQQQLYGLLRKLAEHLETMAEGDSCED
jgi:DNA-binding MarR family transcriptional regulator